MGKTDTQYDQAVASCKGIFLDKAKDYGSSWRILRASSLTDQLYIKAQRVRTIEELGESKIEDSIKNEFMGMVNYSIMAIIQLELQDFKNIHLSVEETEKLYADVVKRSKELMENKNHDYGEAWRSMRTSSFTDLILAKLLRIKQIEDNGGVTSVSEGMDANYFDIINYAIFALIKIKEQNEKIN